MTKIIEKQEIISDLEKRVADKILEQSNFDLLKKLVENADTLDEAIMIAELGTTYKRTGFHFDKRLEKTDGNDISYFKKNNELSFEINPNATTHKLIVGDNYPALLNLLVEYRGKIDVIYIDPPYGKDSMGEFAETNYDNAITRDNLLSMLYPRLYLAKQLLSESGVIFCSIDDRNQAYVKCLFDEVFEESNFIAQIVVETANGVFGTRASGLKTTIVKVKDNVLVYSKTNTDKNFQPLYMSTNDRFDTHYSIMLDENLNRTNFLDYLKNAESTKVYFEKYRLKISLDNVSKIMSIDKDFNKIIINDLADKIYQDVAFSLKVPEEYEKELQNGKIIKYKDYLIFRTNSGNGTVRQLIPFSESLRMTDEYLPEFRRAVAMGDLWENFDNDMKNVKSECFNLPFDNPKPVRLIKLLSKFANNKEAIILDFFAGSGTTGQAVLELNKEDGGTRQFILATANEITSTTPNGVVADVTSKRLKRVMTGECYDGTNNFEWANKNAPLGDNLLVLYIAEVFNREAVAGKTAFDVIDETLYGKEKFTTVQEKVEWLCDNFEVTQKRLEEK